MSEDARNSLIAFASVLAIFGSFYLVTWLTPDNLEVPAWLGLAAVALCLFINLVRAIMARRRRRRQGAA
jgi:hypothetical protein